MTDHLGQEGKPASVQFFTLQMNDVCQRWEAQIAVAMKKKGNKAWLGRAMLEIFQMIAYFVGDNGIIGANAAWQGRRNSQCKTQRSGTTG